MATNDYIISFTDPLNGSLTVKQKTTNGAVLPTAPEPYVTYASGADTSIVLHGRGVPNYGDNLQEAIVHLLENFSGAAQPLRPLEGQLWFAVYRYWYDVINARWYVWNKSTGQWLIVRGNGEPVDSGSSYGYSSSVVYTQETQPTNVDSGNYWYQPSTQKLKLVHRLSDVATTFWIECIYKTDNIAPSSPQVTDTPERYLRVFTGQEWINVNSVRASTKEPQNPEPGMIWVDTNITVSGVPSVKVWDHINVQWVDIGTTLLLTGGTFQQRVIFANGAEVTTAPSVANDIVNSGHLEDRLATVAANVTLAAENKWNSGLTTDLPANNFTVTGLRNPSAASEAVPFAFADARYVLNNQASVAFQSVSVTTGLDMNTTKIINLATPTSDYDAVTRKYVEDRLAAITSGGITTNASSIFNDSNSFSASSSVAAALDEIAGSLNTITGDLSTVSTTVNTLTATTIPAIEVDITDLDGRVTILEGSTTVSLPLAGGTMDTSATISLQMSNAEFTDNAFVVHKGYVTSIIQPLALQVSGMSTDIATLQTDYTTLTNDVNALGTTVNTLANTTVPGLTAAVGALQDDVIDSAAMNVTTGQITLTKHDSSTIVVTNSGYPSSINVAYAPNINGVVAKTSATQPTNVDDGLDTLERIVDRRTTNRRNVITLAPTPITALTTGSFQVANDVTAKFFAGALVTISGSTNNNGTYTVQSSAYATGNTTVTLTTSTLVATPVDGNVVPKSIRTPSYIAGDNRVAVFRAGLKLIADQQGMYRQTINSTQRDPGTGYTAQVYASTVTVDGVNHTVTIDNTTNGFPDLSDVVAALNTQLSGFAVAAYDSEMKQLYVVSDTHGGLSSVTVSQGANGIFNNLANVTTTETITSVVEDYNERGSFWKTSSPQTVIDLITAPTVSTKFEILVLGDAAQF